MKDLIPRLTEESEWFLLGQRKVGLGKASKAWDCFVFFLLQREVKGHKVLVLRSELGDFGPFLVFSL